MKKIGYRKWGILFMAVLFSIALVGCNSSAGSGNGGNNPPIKIRDLDIYVEELINDGEKEVMFWFSNNSKYTITFLQIRYVVKDDITKEDLAAKYDYTYGLGDDYTVDQVFMDGIVGDEYADSSAGDSDAIIIEPGRTSPKTSLHRNNIFYVKSQEEFDNMEPDVMTIRYLDKDGVEHTIYYNYATAKYNEEKAD